MRGWLYRSLFIVGTFVLIWLLVIYYWRVNHRMPSGSDVALYMVAAPLALLTFFWLAVKAWGRVTGPSLATAPRAGVAAAVPQTAQSDAQSRAQQERSLRAAIVGSSVRTAHGDVVSELSDKLAANQARLQLDAELTDMQGYPILTGRVQALDEAAQEEALQQWVRLAGCTPQAWTPEQLRAIALGGMVVNELAQQTLAHPLLEPYLQARANHRKATALPALQLLAVLPPNWNNEQRSLVGEWFQYLVQQQGWPTEKLSLQIASTSAGQGMATRAVATLDHLVLEAFRHSKPCFSLVVACESHIGDRTVAAWEDAGQLLNGKSPMARVPGEGAAALLLADPAQAELMACDTCATLHRVVQARRSKSADGSGQVNDQLLIDMVQDALTLGGVAPQAVTLIAADTDHRGSRMTELLGLGMKVFPDLDPNTQIFKVGSQCGETGAVAGLLALALSHQQVLKSSEPSICISNGDGFERTVALLSPWTNSAPTAAV